jgi:hypothetical protein
MELRYDLQITRQLKLVLTGGFIAGVCDITYACTFHGIKSGVSPIRVCQSVAAGLLGRTASFQGGLTTAALGLGLHFFIALSMALTYYAVAQKWPLLWKQWFSCGAFYGLLLYGIMNYIVIPLSATTAGSKDPLWVVLSIVVHAFLIGVPIAYFVRRALA